MLYPLPPNTVVGRFGSNLPGPPQAIPISQISSSSGGGGQFISVKTYGAVGNGVADDTTAIQDAINAVFAQNTSYTPPIENLGILYFPPGKYLISSPLTLDGLVGGVIMGSGRLTTSIYNGTAGGCFLANGMAYSNFSGFQLQSVDDTATLFGLNWDGSSFVATQSNTFQDCFFQGGTANTNIGVDIGAFINIGQGQASENTFLNCFFANLGTGIGVENGNALSNCVYGGNFQGCGTGILVNQGSFPIISGVGFQGNTWDIQILGSAGDTYAISGCRTQSGQFLNALRGNCVVTGCEQLTSVGSPVFCAIEFHGITLIGCTARGGGILKNPNGTSVQYNIQGCEFSATNWSDGNSGGTITNSWYGYTGDSPEAGAGTFVGGPNGWFNFGSSIGFYTLWSNSSCVLTSSYTLANSGSAQQLFNASTAGAVTLAAGAYIFEGFLNISSMSATSGNAEIDILGTGTATTQDFQWWISGLDSSSPGTATTWSSGLLTSHASGAAIVPAATGTSLVVTFKGTFQVTTAGTLIPSITLANAAAAVVNVGSYISFVPPSGLNYVGATSGNWS